MKQRKSKFSPGRWAIERDRFHLKDGPPPPIYEPAQKAAELIPAILKTAGLENKVWEYALINEWPKLVGEQVARRTRPGRIQNRVLIVYVANAVWLSELSRGGRVQMLQNLQTRFGAGVVRDLRLLADPDIIPPRR